MHAAPPESAADKLQRLYYDNPRPEMQPFVPAATRTLLDVGCAKGAFGAAVKAARGATVWGIEREPAAARVAVTRLDRLIERDISAALPELPDAYFDCIACNDVLEHLDDPYSVVAAMPRLLTPRGVVIASLPNVRYWQVALDLVWRGRWQYQDWGVLDKTHLRFFTPRTMVALFEERGFVVALHGINGPPSRLGQLAARLLPPRFRDMQFPQFAVVATRKGH
jgi:2-polyprenyl-3-methyl-5-hydroxy-6-metoxy-1,4-benzoquinol methylase